MRAGARYIASGLLLLAARTVTGDAGAHARSESFSHWGYDDGSVSLRFTVSAREVTRLTPTGFNAGVELGQLAVVALMGGAALALQARPRMAAPSVDLGPAASCASGVYWFLLRGFS